nr:MAG TPA: protein of unknown function (DUF5026) [Caudoviricetes sp.]
MALIVDKTAPAFDLTVIKKRDLVRAQYKTWDEPRNGIVACAAEDSLQVLYLPNIHSAACFFVIRAQEVKDGKWAILLTRDMKTIEEVSMSDGYDASADTSETSG